MEVLNPYENRRHRAPLPDQACLLTILDYSPDIGRLTWRERPLSLFRDGAQSATHNHAAWNAKMAGKPALQQVRSDYFGGTLFGVKVVAHRVIWKMVTGREAAYIDHISGDKLDNQWVNLREVSASGNAKNCAIRSDNTSGVTGVTWTERFGGKWVAQIVSERKTIFIGQFDDFDSAVAARRDAQARLGFHPNHGRAAS